MARPPTRRTSGASKGGSRETPTDFAQDVDIIILSERIETLSKMVVGLAGLGAVDAVLSRGFDGVLAQLQPLRDMAPERTLLDDNQIARLQGIRALLSRRDWDGVASFPNNDQGVPFIFGPDTPAGSSPYGRASAGK